VPLKHRGKRQRAPIATYLPFYLCARVSFHPAARDACLLHHSTRLYLACALPRAASHLCGPRVWFGCWLVWFGVLYCGIHLVLWVRMCAHWFGVLYCGIHLVIVVCFYCLVLCMRGDMVPTDTHTHLLQTAGSMPFDACPFAPSLYCHDKTPSCHFKTRSCHFKTPSLHALPFFSMLVCMRVSASRRSRPLFGVGVEVATKEGVCGFIRLLFTRSYDSCS